MSVEQVLNKISSHNPSVLGCIAQHKGRIFDNLPDLFELIGREELTDHASNIFTLSDELQSDRVVFDQVFLEYPDYSVFARRIDDGVLVLVNTPIPRGTFKKMQVGVNLFLKPLGRALEEDKSDADAAEKDPATSERAGKRMYRGIAY